MDAKKLLDQFLGPNALGGLTNASGGLAQQAQRAKDQLLGQSGQSGGGSFGGGMMGGLAAGGLLGVLLGNKSARKMMGGFAGYGAAAALGALAHRAYQSWSESQRGAPAATPVPATLADAPSDGSPFLPQSGADGQPFALALIRAMIAAAHADGHIGAEENKQIFEAVNRAGLDAQAKAFVFDALAKPLSPRELAGLAAGLEQGAEIYLAARLAIEPDHPAEKAFLDALAGALTLPAGLQAHLDAQVQAQVQAQGEPARLA
jgi:uncharacterized membrane protein YebE (DUF533 family)